MALSSEYTLNVKGNTRGIDDIRKKTNQAGKETRSKTVPAFSRLRDVIKDIGSGDFNQVTQNLFFLTATAETAARTVGKLLTPVTETIRLASETTQGLITRIVNLGSSAEASLTQIGSLFRANFEDAQRLFDGLRQFARPLPVSTRELVDAAILLKSVNLRPSQETLESLLNASLGLRRPINDVAAALQSLTSITLRRLGIVLERTGETARLSIGGGLVKEIENNSDAIRRAIIEGLGEAYAGSIERARGDFATGLAALQSIVDDTFINSSRVLLPTLTGIINRTSEWIGKNEELVQTRIDRFAEVAAEGIDDLGEHIDLFFRIVDTGLGVLTFFFQSTLNIINLVADGISLVDTFFRSFGANARVPSAAELGILGSAEVPGQFRALVDSERLTEQTRKQEEAFKAADTAAKGAVSTLEDYNDVLDELDPKVDALTKKATDFAAATFSPFTLSAITDQIAAQEKLFNRISTLPGINEELADLQNALSTGAIARVLELGLISPKDFTRLKQTVTLAAEFNPIFREVRDDLNNYRPQALIDGLDQIRRQLPEPGQIIGLSPDAQRTILKDLREELRALQTEFKDFGLRLNVEDEFPDIVAAIQEALAPPSVFFQEVSKGFAGALNSAVTNVFEGNESILGVFSEASRRFADGIQAGLTGQITQGGQRFFNRGLRSSLNNLGETFSTEIASLKSTFQNAVGPERAQQIGQVASGGLALAGGIQQGGVGGFVSGAVGGASIGLALGGPVGAVVGGIIGGVASLFGGGKKQRIRVETAAFTVAQATTRDFVDGIGTGYLRATEKGIEDFNALDANVLTGLAIQDYLRGVRASLETLPGAIRDLALQTFDNFEFDAQKLFSEGGQPTLQSFKSFLEGGLSGRLTQQLAPVFVGIFESLGVSAERASEYINSRFAEIAGSHSQEVAKQLEERFRRDFNALIEIIGLVEGNTGFVGAIDRAKFLIRDLGIEVNNGLAFDAAISRARELVTSLEIDEDTAAKIREVTELLVNLPIQLSSSIRGTLGRIQSLSQTVGIDLSQRIAQSLRGNIASIDNLLANTNLSIEQRSAALSEQNASITELVNLERKRFNETKQAQIDLLDSQLAALRELEVNFQGVFDRAGDALLRLDVGSGSQLSPAQQIQAIQSEISRLQARVPVAEGQELADIQSELTRLFPEAVRIATQGFGEGSSAAFAILTNAQEGLKRIQEETQNEILNQQQIALQQADILARMEELQNREFRVSQSTREIIDVHLSNQIAVLEAQEGLQAQMHRELVTSNRFLQGIQRAITQVANRPINITVSPTLPVDGGVGFT